MMNAVPRGHYVAQALRRLSLPDEAIYATLVAELGLAQTDAIAALESAKEEAPPSPAMVAT
jgi:hypothetical protein